MNRIVKEHYPVEKLPEDLREGFAQGALVRVTLIVEDKDADAAILEELDRKLDKARADVARGLALGPDAVLKELEAHEAARSAKLA